jgi:hypothetical protein
MTLFSSSPWLLSKKAITTTSFENKCFHTYDTAKNKWDMELWADQSCRYTISQNDHRINGMATWDVNGKWLTVKSPQHICPMVKRIRVSNLKFDGPAFKKQTKR